MKRCPKCGEVKPLNEFSKHRGRRDGVQSMCRPCRRIYDRERYERIHGRTIPYRPNRSEPGRSAWLRGLKEGRACADCGTVYPPQVMQWDHKPGFEKVGDVSQAFWGRTREEVVAEIAKCDLVCANCHAIRTFTRSEWGQKWLRESALMYDACAFDEAA
ncbi:MAG TPA: hypothetical protein VI814_00395 [Candidatus Limnocylindria bacterium]